MTKIKICGIKERDHALFAARAGADFIGLVFAPGRRQITEQKAIDISASLRTLRQRPFLTGVFVNSPHNEINRIAARCGLDWVQLSGDEDWDYCRRVELPVIKAVHIHKDTSIAQMLKTIERGYSLIGSERLIFLLDTGLKDAYGGTGVTFNWELAQEIISQHPVIVAGGLNPENVTELITRYAPWGVDVSTGVETNGQKDTGRIEAFIQAVRPTEKEQ